MSTTSFVITWLLFRLFMIFGKWEIRFLDIASISAKSSFESELDLSTFSSPITKFSITLSLVLSLKVSNFSRSSSLRSLASSNLKANSEPSPHSLSNPMSPLNWKQIYCDILRPRPIPRVFYSSVVSIKPNSLNNFDLSSSLIPLPVSWTWTSQ